MTKSPDELQRLAADPNISAWVEASAGSGKTKVLTDRVLNLLLAGTEPEKILCLTFTKTAAANMANKISERLALWASMPEKDLENQLFNLSQKQPSPEKIKLARQLFARLLDSAGGLKATTIHGFCQSLLKRFPLEAKIPPEFDVMDEIQAKEMISMVQEKVLQQPKLKEQVQTIIKTVKQNTFLEVLEEVLFKQSFLKEFVDKYPTHEQRKASYETALGLPKNATKESIIEDFLTLSDDRKATLKQAFVILEQGKKVTDKKTYNALALILSEQLTDVKEYISTFITNEDTIRNFATKDCSQAIDLLTPEANNALKLRQDLKSVDILKNSLALLEISIAITQEYSDLKKQRSCLDFSDLILSAKHLLESSGAAAWVLFKLDGGIHHILVDEAQDTSPEQWAIVKNLADEFFTGNTLNNVNRTIFAVGDKKQSIFSFQGADPKEFKNMHEYFAQKVKDAKKTFSSVPMNTSFRSGQSVIDAVNIVYNNGYNRKGVLEIDEDATHIAFRKGQDSLFELWPIEPVKTEKDEAFSISANRNSSKHPKATLAEKVAKKIFDMVDKEDLPSKNRKVRPKDILILVRKRGDFVHNLSRELKSLNIEVAGLDRLTITDHIAIQDLMVLGDFLLLPEDDLALATVLRSPLCGLCQSDLSEKDVQKVLNSGVNFDGISEETLFDLAYNRKGTLFNELLKHKNETNTPLGKAFLFLNDLLLKADKTTPFELYSYILGTLGKQKLLLTRLGIQALDAIEEFMSLALKYEQTNIPSLQGFLDYLRKNEIEIKRDPEQSAFDAVRIMTVHASKGLEAPIVFLPDANQYNFKSPRTVWLKEKQLLWAGNRDLRDKAFENELENLKDLNIDESHRLLYVALTRAADRLYVTGWENKKGNSDEAWHPLVSQAFHNKEDNSYKAEIIPSDLLTGNTLRLHSLQEENTAKKAETTILDSAKDENILPTWVNEPAPCEPTPSMPLMPSRLDEKEPAFASPRTPNRVAFMQRGIAVHALLEHLPKYPANQRFEVALKILKNQNYSIPTEQSDTLIQSVLAVIENPEFAPLFSDTSMAEVPLSGVIKGNITVNAKIDRLCILENDVLIVDYKSNQTVPRTLADTPEAYINQLGLYRLLLQKIYPEKTIRCFLLWTEEAKLSEITSLICDTMTY